jgi:hypothetical protein
MDIYTLQTPRAGPIIGIFCMKGRQRRPEQKIHKYNRLLGLHSLPVKPGKGGFDPLGVQILGKGRIPFFGGSTNPDPAMDQAAFVGLNTPGNYVPQNQGAGQDRKPLAGKYITPNYPADSYYRPADVTAHPCAFPHHHPAGNRQITPDITIDPGKTVGTKVAV